MTIREGARTAAAIHRKLRGLASVFSDAAAEKATAERLKARLEEQLPQEPAPSEPAPSAAWTNIMFRLGQGVREMTSPAPLQSGIGPIMLFDWAECSGEV